MCAHNCLLDKSNPKLLKGKLPYEVIYGCMLSYNEMRVFGILCFARNNPPLKDKFASRNKRCVFLGYPSGKKGWRVYDLEKSETFASRGVIFV